MQQQINLEELKTIVVDGIEFTEAVLWYKGELIRLPHTYVSRCGKLYKKERQFGKHTFKAGYVTQTLADMGVNRSRKEYIFGIKVNGKILYPRTSRVVASTFIENDNPVVKDTVNHKNETITDNRVSNLEWLSNADNIRYSQEKRAKSVSEARSRIVEITNGEQTFLAKSISIGVKHLKELGGISVEQSSASKCVNGKVKSAGKLNQRKLIWSEPEDVEAAKKLLADSDSDFIELT